MPITKDKKRLKKQKDFIGKILILGNGGRLEQTITEEGETIETFIFNNCNGGKICTQ